MIRCKSITKLVTENGVRSSKSSNDIEDVDKFIKRFRSELENGLECSAELRREFERLYGRKKDGR